jgi:hypothetical protein
MCGRPMKLQWKRHLAVATPDDFFWGCTGWYVSRNGGAACNHRQDLDRSDYGLMTDTTAPEFAMTSEEFGIILSHKTTESIIDTRLNDLRADLDAKQKGVELVTCPVHGENMILRRKQNAAGLLDSYFLACVYWKPRNEGCTFIEKLKSGSQLAALLKSETGRGVL